MFGPLTVTARRARASFASSDGTEPPFGAKVRRVRERPGRPIDNDVMLAAGQQDAGPKGDRARFPGYDQAVSAVLISASTPSPG
jgi:hypothetical protein